MVAMVYISKVIESLIEYKEYSKCSWLMTIFGLVHSIINNMGGDIQQPKVNLNRL